MPSDRLETVVRAVRETGSIVGAAQKLGISRYAARAVLNRAGKSMRDVLKESAFLDAIEDAGDIPVEWDEPETNADPFPTVRIEADRAHVDREPEPVKRSSTNLRSYLIWSDAHVPFEDREAFDLVLQVGHALKPYGTVIIGDFADMLSVSTHPKTPTQLRWQLKDEVEAVNARLDQIDALGCVDKRFCGGNHSTRGQRLAVKQAIGLYDMLDPAHLFKLKERGWQYYPYQQAVKVGKVWFVHDCGHSGKYAVFQNGAAFESSTIQGHTHAAGVTYFGNALGERHVSAVVGWLGSKEAADYLAAIKVTRNWTTAFAMMWVEEDTGNSHVQVIPIVEGRCVVNGQLFVAGQSKAVAA